MGRNAHRQRQSPLGARGLRRLNRAPHRIGVAGDDHLTGRVEVDRFDDLIPGGSHAYLPDLIVTQAKNRRHRATTRGYRLLHEAPARCDDAHSVSIVHGPSTYQRGKLTEAVTGHPGGPRSAPLVPYPPDSDSRRQHRRLGVLGAIQLFLRPLGDQLPKITLQNLGCLGESFDHGSMLGGERAQHADGLGALARENNGKIHDCRLW